MAYDNSMFVPPWHEWSNDFINAEKWDQFKDVRTYIAFFSGKKKIAAGIGCKILLIRDVIKQDYVFKHPGGHERLPKEIAGLVKKWERPDKIFGDADGLVVQSTTDKNDVYNLLTVNKTLMDVKVIF